MPSIYEETALKVIKGYNDWNMDSMMSYRASNCVQQVLPESLGREPLDNAAYKAYFGGLLSSFSNFHVKVKDLIVDEKNHKVAIWGASTADSVIGPYSNEYMVTIYLTKEGDKVEKILEFVDSLKSASFFTKLAAHLEKQPAS